MNVAELGEGLRVYRTFLQNEIRMCQTMLGRRDHANTNPFWHTTKGTYMGCLDKLERQFPFLREI